MRMIPIIVIEISRVLSTILIKSEHFALSQQELSYLETR